MPKFRVVGQDSSTEIEPDESDNEKTLSGGDGGGTSGDMERRLSTLEKGMEKVIGKLDDIQSSIGSARLDAERRFGSIDSRLLVIETKLDSKLATTDLTPIEARIGTLDGKVSNIPTVWQTLAIMAGLMVGVGSLAFTLAKLARP